MRFTDKALGSIDESVSILRENIQHDVRNMTREISALAGLGMIAFALISIVAVTALVKASK